jgi:hypothetical protein
MSFFSEAIETMDRGELDAPVDERTRYTVQFAVRNSPFWLSIMFWIFIERAPSGRRLSQGLNSMSLRNFDVAHFDFETAVSGISDASEIRMRCGHTGTTSRTERSQP